MAPKAKLKTVDSVFIVFDTAFYFHFEKMLYKEN